MVRIFRVKDSEEINRGGYIARYFADILFRRNLDSAGFIYVSVPVGSHTKPHSHEILEEIFVALTPLAMNVNGHIIGLELGDLVLVEPGDYHSIIADKDHEGKLLAVKFPNIKDDKLSMDDQ